MLLWGLVSIHDAGTHMKFHTILAMHLCKSSRGSCFTLLCKGMQSYALRVSTSVLFIFFTTSKHTEYLHTKKESNFSPRTSSYHAYNKEVINFFVLKLLTLCYVPELDEVLVDAFNMGGCVVLQLI